MSLSGLHLSLLHHLSLFSRHSVSKSFRLSFHAFYEWTGEQEPRGRLGEPAGRMDLMTAHFRELYAPHSHYAGSLMSRFRICFGGYIDGMAGQDKSGGRLENRRDAGKGCPLSPSSQKEQAAIVLLVAARTALSTESATPLS